MLVKDCNKLVEQIKARIQNWKHRALSFAGRLQLINYVLQSLQVYWCSVVLLPKTTIKDLEKVFKGFLWNGGDLKKGSAKIAWKMVCRPKEEGGLGIRNLQTWNEALLSRQIWRLFTATSSLWVDWVKIHHLRKQTFWEVKSKDLEGCSWSNMLSLRDKIWKHIWRVHGDGMSINLWYDNWHAGGPLINIITEDERNLHGLPNDLTVHQFCSNHTSGWPWEWGDRFPNIQLQGLPNLEINKDDGIYWRDLEGKSVEFSPTQVWKDIRIASPVVPWYKVVWFKLNIPSHAFILWLAIHDRLMTQERMQIWQNSANLKCMLCKMVSDSTTHLFFECQYSHGVWTKVCDMCNIQFPDFRLKKIIEYQIPRLQSNHIQTEIEKLALAATIYLIWRERNSRHHNGSTASQAKLVNQVLNSLKTRF
ncbi:unnamed protein product [Lactuca virosa]|uniref:Reverse transcriptase zinc-binding domain-containing protein n=1 Tax=Lactuca virosa TaxID=75947 RepID=A0AAU9M3P2_9ASTR|nr:unnamed protein product [Lactuca virosa]